MESCPGSWGLSRKLQWAAECVITASPRSVSLNRCRTRLTSRVCVTAIALRAVWALLGDSRAVTLCKCCHAGLHFRLFGQDDQTEQQPLPSDVPPAVGSVPVPRGLQPRDGGAAPALGPALPARGAHRQNTRLRRLHPLPAQETGEQGILGQCCFALYRHLQLILVSY